LAEAKYFAVSFRRYQTHRNLFVLFVPGIVSFLVDAIEIFVLSLPS